MSKYKRRGWFGDSAGHALAAKGVKVYNAHKNESIFYYQQRELNLSTNHINDMVIRDKLTLGEMTAMHKGTSEQELRMRGINAIESKRGDNTLSKMNELGVDATLKLAESSTSFRRNAEDILKNPQLSSFIGATKTNFLRARLGLD